MSTTKKKEFWLGGGSHWNKEEVYHQQILSSLSNQEGGDRERLNGMALVCILAIIYTLTNIEQETNA
jgi:hypothetical protein